MIQYAKINTEWRVEHEYYPNGKSDIYRYKGAEMFGTVVTYPHECTPSGAVSYFETDCRGNRHEITYERLRERIKRIYHE
mgnify:CR=1 FL=1